MLDKILETVKEIFDVDIDTEDIRGCITKLENLSKQRDITFSEEAVELSITLADLLPINITKSVELSTFIVNEIKRLNNCNNHESCNVCNSSKESYNKKLEQYSLKVTKQDIENLHKIVMKESDHEFSMEFMNTIAKLHDGGNNKEG